LFAQAVWHLRCLNQRQGFHSWSPNQGLGLASQLGQGVSIGDIPLPQKWADLWGDYTKKECHCNIGQVCIIKQ